MKLILKNKIFLFMIFALLLIAGNHALALPDNVINYQGKLTDKTTDVAVADGNYSMIISIYTVATGGTPVWTARGTVGTPTAKTVAVSKGIFSTVLGEAGDNAIGLDFNTQYYLGVKVGGDSEMDPRKPITASGFAINSSRLNGQLASFYLDTSATTQTKSGALTVNGNMTVGDSNADALIVYGGNSSGDIRSSAGALNLTPYAGSNLNVNLGTTGDFIVNTNQFYVDTSSGNVGIGTTSPASVLEVDANTTTITAIFAKAASSGVSIPFLVSADSAGRGFIIGQQGMTPSNFSVGGVQFNATATGGTLAAFSNIGLGTIGDLVFQGGGGNVGIGTTSPTAVLHLKAGTATAGTAPLKFTSGTNLTTAEAGAMEWDGTNLFITQTSGPTRKTIAYTDSTMTGTFDGINLATGTQGGVGYFSSTTQLSSSALGTTGQALISGGTGAPTWYAPTAGSILFAGTSGILAQDNSNLFWDNTNKRLGIGTTTPSLKLEVSGATDAQIKIINTGDSQSGIYNYSNRTATDVGIANFNAYWNNTLVGLISVETGDDTTNKDDGLISFWTAESGSIQERMRIEQNGYVGIGTASPSNLLHVFSSTASAIALAESTLSNGIGGIAIKSDTSSAAFLTYGSSFSIPSVSDSALLYTDTNASNGLMLDTEAAAPIKFSTSGYTNVRMIISSTGDVGIGTTSPTAVLHLKAGTATASTAPLKFTSGTNLTTAEAGAMEWDGTSLYISQTSGPTRKTIAFTDSTMTGTFDGINLGTGTQGGVGYFSSTTQLSSSALGTTGQALISGGTGAPTWYAPTAGSILFAGTSGILAQDNSNLFWDNTNKRLGIGTASPLNSLSIGASLGGPYGGKVITLGAADYAQFILGEDANNLGDVYWNGSDDTLRFTTIVAGTMKETMVLDNGNVGIGTATPTANFQVAQATAGTGAVTITGNTTCAGTGTQFTNTFKVGDSIIITATSETRAISAIASDTSMTIASATNTAGSAYTLAGGTRFSVLGNGNVGIGTTSPTYPLHIYRANTYSGIYMEQTGAGDYYSGIIGKTDDSIYNISAYDDAYSVVSEYPGKVVFQVAGGDLALVVNDAAEGMEFYTGGRTATNKRMVIDNNGLVGIGTATPTAQLHTTSTVRFANFGAGTLVTDASGNVSVSSDERLKNINGNFTRGIEDLMGLNPISFNWQENSGMDLENSYVGFSAQNVQQYIPEAVGEDSRGFLTLSDRPILATAINSIKVQQEQILGISENVSELSSVNQDLILKTDGNISTIAELQKSIDENLEKISNSQTSISSQIVSQAQNIESLQSKTSDQENRIKSIEDMLAILQNKFNDFKEPENQELILAQIDLNRTDIDYLNLILGLDGTRKPGDIKMGGQLEAKKIVAETFGVEVISEKNKSIGTVEIKAGEKLVIVETEVIDSNSKIFITPNQPVGVGVGSVKNGESFEIETSVLVEKDLKIDWWIVDEK